MKPKIKESVVVKQCLEYLDNKGIVAWRNNSGLLFIQGRRVQLGATGSPDIIGLTENGLFLGIECKSAIGVQSDNQKAFETKIKASKGIYLLVHSKEELEQLI